VRTVSGFKSQDIIIAGGAPIPHLQLRQHEQITLVC
jgi:hypothetical protein